MNADPPETTPEWTRQDEDDVRDYASLPGNQSVSRLARAFLRLRSEREAQDAEIARLNEEIVECRRAPSPMPELNAVGEALVQMRTQFESAMEKADELEVGLDDAHSTIATMQRSIDGWREKAYQLERERAALEITAVSLRSELSRSLTGEKNV
jgi:chromosome segregation ATPase